MCRGTLCTHHGPPLPLQTPLRAPLPAYNDSLQPRVGIQRHYLRHTIRSHRLRERVCTTENQNTKYKIRNFTDRPRDGRTRIQVDPTKHLFMPQKRRIPDFAFRHNQTQRQ